MPSPLTVSIAPLTVVIALPATSSMRVGMRLQAGARTDSMVAPALIADLHLPSIFTPTLPLILMLTPLISMSPALFITMLDAPVTSSISVPALSLNFWPMVLVALRVTSSLSSLPHGHLRSCLHGFGLIVLDVDGFIVIDVDEVVVLDFLAHVLLRVQEQLLAALLVLEAHFVEVRRAPPCMAAALDAALGLVVRQACTAACCPRYRRCRSPAADPGRPRGNSPPLPGRRGDVHRAPALAGP